MPADKIIGKGGKSKKSSSWGHLIKSYFRNNAKKLICCHLMKLLYSMIQICHRIKREQSSKFNTL